jgi:hypothetical protein
VGTEVLSAFWAHQCQEENEMKKSVVTLSGVALAALLSLAAGPASAWWGSGWGDGYYGPWGGGPWYGGYPGYGWGGYPGYGWGGYPGYGWGYPAYGWGYPATVAPVAPAQPATGTEMAK